jgi:hypothetical protein
MNSFPDLIHWRIKFLFEFQKGNPEEKAQDWTAKPRKLSRVFVGGGLKCAALMVSPGKMSR